MSTSSRTAVAPLTLVIVAALLSAPGVARGDQIPWVSPTFPKPAPNLTHPEAGPGSAEEEVLRAEHERLDAMIRGDLAALERLYHADFISTGRTGIVTTRSEYFEALRIGATKVESFEHSNVQVRVYGDTVVVTGRTVGRGRVLGADITGRPGRFTHVYVKAGDRWQIVAMHDGPAD